MKIHFLAKDTISRTNILIKITAFLWILNFSNVNGEEINKINPTKTNSISLTSDNQIDTNNNTYFGSQTAVAPISKFKTSEWFLYYTTENQYYFINHYETWRDSNEITIPLYTNYKKINNGAQSVTSLIKINCTKNKRVLLEINAWSELNGGGFTVGFLNKSHPNYGS
jgi:hypothetical protein